MQSSHPVRKISDRQVRAEAFSSHTFDEMLIHQLWGTPLILALIVLLGLFNNRVAQPNTNKHTAYLLTVSLQFTGTLFISSFTSCRAPLAAAFTNLSIS